MSFFTQLLDPDFYFKTTLAWLPLIFFWGVFLVAAFSYLNPLKNLQVSFKRLALYTIIFRASYAFALTAAQYRVWASEKLTQSFLTSPIAGDVPLPLFLKPFSGFFESGLGYFLFYSWGRFWMNVFLVLIIACAFWGFLRLLKRYKE